MGQIQSIVMLLAVVALGAAPWVWSKAKQWDARRRELSGPEMVAYLMYVERCGGNRESLAHYERSKYLQSYWLEQAKRRMAAWPGKVDSGRTDAAG